MAAASKKKLSTDNFFTEKVRLEKDLMDFERKILEANNHLTNMENSLAQMHSIAEENHSYYFLKRVKKLQTLYFNLQRKKGYTKDDFDSFYHHLGKIVNEDKIEFLDSALRNRITKVAAKLGEAGIIGQKKKEIDLAGKIRFLAFEVEGVHFLVPKTSYRILKNIPAFKSKLSIKKTIIPLFPGPGFILLDDTKPASKKNIILIKNSKGKEEGYYFDKLEEDWAISKQSIDLILKKEKSNDKVIGKIRRKGIYYHLLRAD
ncbi:hypothetical protein LPTSP3_g03440 [Leptospira kobayashii]|uniref:Uncharacterized protein n=1 Tax=Leptospira kobayashii TaxID=1917830 RepID=A0ABN6KCN6_9LEPT|nr:hypothetical protein [Leptospira kobayashii]BDA77414.1 hypothetical protein LPTSP3_g03440 [Leptospira kobayashii]